MSKSQSESKTRAVLQILVSNGSVTNEELTRLCSFETRMETAGTLALLRRQKAIELVPESYRITEAGKNYLEKPTTKPESKPIKQQAEITKEEKHLRKDKPANKAFQIKFLTKVLEKLNPGSSQRQSISSES